MANAIAMILRPLCSSCVVRSAPDLSKDLRNPFCNIGFGDCAPKRVLWGDFLRPEYTDRSSLKSICVKKGITKRCDICVKE